MVRSTLTALGTALAMTLFAVPSLAQQVCGKRADIVKRLNSSFEEQRRSAGLVADGNLVEVFASKQGIWTIIYTQPGGLTCLVAVGDNWQQIKARLTATGRILSGEAERTIWRGLSLRGRMGGTQMQNRRSRARPYRRAGP